jgi:outer membrane protein OmpA-like peptidoglycan-associated protein
MRIQSIFCGLSMSLALVLSIVCMQGSAIAAESIADDVVESEDIVTGLIPITGTEGQIDRRALDLRVKFSLGSDKLTPDGKAQLDRLAKALDDKRLSGLAFEIIGHTDATGSAESNMALSEARARSVAEYLVGSHGIDAQRLSARGEGETRLLNELEPAAAENRRVEIVSYEIPADGKNPEEGSDLMETQTGSGDDGAITE